MMRFSIQAPPLILLLFVVALKLTCCNAQQATDSCHQFGPLQLGQGIWGVNQGGCYSCVVDPSTAELEALAGNELLDACRQMCTADPLCVAFEIVESPLAPFYDYYGLGIFNCCIERSPILPSSELFTDASSDPSSNCGKEMSCWSWASRTSTNDTTICPATEPSPKCILNFPGAATAQELAEEIDYFITFLADDCPAGDSVEQTLLDVASEVCFAETEYPMEECAFDEPQRGRVLFGANQGGCFSCHHENDINLPLEGQDLVDACRQMCTADPLCVAFEVAADPAVLPLEEWRWDDPTPNNCCLEHDSVAPSNPLFLAASNSQRNNNCHKEASCWSSISKTSPTACKLTNPSPLCDVRFPGYTSPQDYQEQSNFLMEWIANGCPYEDSVGQILVDNAGETCLAELPPAPPEQTQKKTDPPTVTIESGAFDSGRQSHMGWHVSLFFLLLVWPRD